ncbi:MAG: hypothetical protein HYV09_24120 [Deltaproteobacteria bacterium]|nr:hypothetical protein [Deltaproteobacteria bacterium]
MPLAIALVLAAAAADLAIASRDARVAGARASFLPAYAIAAAMLAALLPLGVMLAEPSLSHVAPVPSWDLLRPCLAPPHPATRAHAWAPFALVRVLLPAAIALGLRARTLPRARFLLGASAAVALTVLSLGVHRLAKGGADPAEVRTCGALTPEEGADGRAVRALLDRVNVGARQELIRFRELPRLRPPPWMRAEIAVTIGGEPYSLRPRGPRVVAEPDDARRAERPLPALHFASIPAIEHGTTPDGRPATVLLDRRSNGRWFAIRVGQPARFSEVAPLLRAPWWPVALLGACVIAVASALWATRARPRVASALGPYRAPPDEPRARPLAPAIHAVCAFVLVEASFTALRALAPYL